MAGGPPPPPPPGGNVPARPTGVPQNRGALLSDISKGAPRLRKAVTNDRSAPIVGKSSGASSGPPIGGAPPVPGIPKPPGGLAPPVPGGNRLRSNSDQGRTGAGAGASVNESSTLPSAPQLGGLFAGGMPKLKKRGGIDTGASADASYLSDSESSRKPGPWAPTGSAPPPPN
ncbi:hypothetical protein EMPG_10254, partial [Blastomyces silverae]